MTDEEQTKKLLQEDVDSAIKRLKGAASGANNSTAEIIPFPRQDAKPCENWMPDND